LSNPAKYKRFQTANSACNSAARIRKKCDTTINAQCKRLNTHNSNSQAGSTVMIPQISQAPGVVQLVLNFLQALEQQGFTGDTATSYADRLTMATDNSIYQLLPDAVVFPRSTAD